MSEERRAELRADVAMMRELGVSEWGDIRLGPPPRVPGEPPREPTADEVRARLEALEEGRLNILFGATGVRPRRW